MALSAERLLQYRSNMEDMYGPFGGTTALATIHEASGMEPVPFDQALDKIFGGG
jgi:hypothetical protein